MSRYSVFELSSFERFSNFVFRCHRERGRMLLAEQTHGVDRFPHGNAITRLAIRVSVISAVSVILEPARDTRSFRHTSFGSSGGLLGSWVRGCHGVEWSARRHSRTRRSCSEINGRRTEKERNRETEREGGGEEGKKERSREREREERGKTKQATHACTRRRERRGRDDSLIKILVFRVCIKENHHFKLSQDH